MASWFEQISSNMANCFERWEKVTLTPARFFLRTTAVLDSTCLIYFMGMQLLSYIAALFTMFVFFAAFYLPVLRKLIVEGALKDTVSNMSALFVVFVVLQLLSIGLSSIIGFSVYRALGSKVTLKSQFASLLYMSNSDPLMLIGLAAFLMAPGLLPNRGKLILAFCLGGLALFVVARIYYLVLGFIGMSSLHSLKGWRRPFGFLVGFMPVTVSASIFSGIVVFGFAVLMVGILDTPKIAPGIKGVVQILSGH